MPLNNTRSLMRNSLLTSKAPRNNWVLFSRQADRVSAGSKLLYLRRKNSMSAFAFFGHFRTPSDTKLFPPCQKGINGDTSGHSPGKNVQNRDFSQNPPGGDNDKPGSPPGRN